MNRRHLLKLTLPAAAAWLCGCSGAGGGKSTVTVSTSTAGTKSDSPARVTPVPSVIYVSDFYLDPQMITPTPGVMGDREGPASRVRGNLKGLRESDPASKARDIVKTLGVTITRELQQAGYRAEHRPGVSGLRQEFFPTNADLPKDGWLLGGWFEHVQEGNRVEQATVGFGQGSGSVSIEVIVSDLAGDPRKPFLFIGSENGQHRMPGGLVTMNPYAMAAKFELARGQTQRDVKTMGSAIAKTLIQYLEQGAGSPATAPQ